MPLASASVVERLRMLDRALDEIGAGCFQGALFFIIALGFFVEAAELQLVGVLMARFELEWHAGAQELALIPSMTSFGGMVGVLVFGLLADTYGRKFSYHVSFTICSVFSFLSSFATSVSAYAVLRFGMGLGYGAHMISAATLLIESSPTAWRGYFIALTSIALHVGGLFASLFAWAFMDTLG